jgi:type IV pilus assembly protein PilX
MQTLNQADWRAQPARRQRGAVLVVGLIFLAVLSLLGVAAYGSATQEERMSGNARDRLRALEAAESSARDCEAFIGTAVPAFSGSGGMYEAPPYGDPDQWQVITESNAWADATQTRVLATPLADVALQPRCIAERQALWRDATDSHNEEPYETEVYQITAVGYGTNANNSAMVHTIYRRE